ncbi:NADH:ubiquinone oxidoreductase intermediate-associated protein 30, partial [Apodospora peruviana]
WKESDWTASDDRVRGGKSVSNLTVVDNKAAAVKFHGCLDITALGGAGFASQRTVDDHVPPFDLAAVGGYDTLVLDIIITSDNKSSDDNKYTIVLKDTVLPKRPDGREQSTVSWEHDFTVSGTQKDAARNDGSSSSIERRRIVVLRFGDFRPMYRGKPAEDAKPLDWANIKRISIMIRSFFGEQEGPFTLYLSSIAACKESDLKMTLTSL